MADNHTPIVKILLDLGVADLGDISTDKDYLKALIKATNQLDAKDGRYPILQQEIKKLRAISFARGGSPRRGGQLAATQPSTGLSPSTLKGSDDSSDISSKLSVIEGNLQSILDVFRSQFNLDKKKAERDRKAQEEAVKKGREDKLESTGADTDGGSKILKKVTKPVQGFLDKLLNFFKNILMGGALVGLLKIIQNPDIILQPIKDFIDGLSEFFNKILKVVFDIVFFPINALIAGINMGMRGIMAAFDGVMRLFDPSHKSSDEFPQIPYMEAPQIPLFSKEKEEDDTKGTQGEKGEKGDTGEGGQGPGEGFSDVQARPRLGKSTPGGFTKEITGSVESVPEFNKGGVVPGSGNRDTVPAMLTPGEFVMSKGAVQSYGSDTLAGMNAAAGGTNKPTGGRYSDGGFVMPQAPIVRGYSGGGEVLPQPQQEGNRGFLGWKSSLDWMTAGLTDFDEKGSGGNPFNSISGGRKDSNNGNSATIGAPSNTIVLPPSPMGHKVKVIPVPSSNDKGPPLNSGSSASQKDVTPFSAKDLNNMEMLAIQSQYSIVG